MASYFYPVGSERPSQAEVYVQVRVLNAAVLAERERCALIAERFNARVGDQTDAVVTFIAEEIRNGPSPD
jgi:hypothetical protein